MRRLLSMRWWLAFAFAAIAALTAASVVAVVTGRSQTSFRESSQRLALGSAAAAAVQAESAPSAQELPAIALETAERHDLAVFFFDAAGELLTAPTSDGIRLGDVPAAPEALDVAVSGRRFVRSTRDGSATVVALPVQGVADAVVGYARRPEVAAQRSLVRDEVLFAALLATAIGALTGLAVASVITARLRNIADAAAAIEAGDFDRRLTPRFPDELGSLASSINHMRARLEVSFATLRADRDRFERVLGRLRDGVVTIDADLRVDVANDAVRRLLAAPALETGDRLPDPWDGRPLQELARPLFAPGAAPENRVVVDGDRTYVLVGLPPAEGETAVIVVSDVSERERIERAQREFATNAAHELRTPVAAIVTSIDLLQRGAKDRAEARERFLAHIEREAHRLARLTNALLVLARAQAREEQPSLAGVRVRPLLETLADTLSVRPGVELEVDCPDDLAVAAHPDLIEQALASIAGNAAKFTAAGTIRLSARRSPTGTVLLEVCDTGPGIGELERERVFDRFYGANGGGDGFGLGLAISRQAVEALGGRIEVVSNAGPGTTVVIELPEADPRR